MSEGYGRKQRAMNQSDGRFRNNQNVGGKGGGFRNSERGSRRRRGGEGGGRAGRDNWSSGRAKGGKGGGADGGYDGNNFGNFGHSGERISETERWRVDNGRNFPENQSVDNAAYKSNFENINGIVQDKSEGTNFNHEVATPSEKGKFFPKFRDLQYQQQQQQQQQRFRFDRRPHRWHKRDDPIQHNTKPPQEDGDAAKKIDSTVNLAPAPTKELDSKPAPAPEVVKKPDMIVNIKVEKAEKVESKPIVAVNKSDSSSDSSTDEEAQNENIKTVDDKNVKIKVDFPKPEQKVKSERSPKKVQSTNKKPASSSSSSEEDSSSDEETVSLPKVPAKKPSSSSSSSSDQDTSTEEENTSKKVIAVTSPSTPKKPTKTELTKNKKKTSKPESTEEEVVCLGKVENKFVVDDEESLASDENNESKSTKICMLCDKKGHTSFECQMICKNCSEPYHNLKKCPKPANLSLVLQSFMEFCMQQMTHYNPEEKYQFEKQIENNNKIFSMAQPTASLTSASNTHGKQKRKSLSKSKELHKKTAKKRRMDESDENYSNDSSTSQSESDESCQTASTSTKLKKKRSKASTLTPASFSSPFAAVNSTVSPFANLTGVEHHPMAAATGFNPMLPMFYQMLQGATHPSLNFKR